MAKKFNLAEYVKDDMSKMDTGAEQITLLPLDKLIPDERNFYSLDGIDELAANIETVGLMDPIRVRPQGGEYVIVSGHRRRAACMLIRDGGNPMFDRGVPCIIELGAASDAMRELRLIFANSATRQLTSAELSKQAERTNAVLLQLKKEGFEFKGKTRELVAEILHASESKIARVTAIRKNLIDGYLSTFDDGRLQESSAYRLSQESQKTQRDVFTRLGPAACSLTAADLDKVIDQVKHPKPDDDSSAAPAEKTESVYRSEDAVSEYLAGRMKEDRTYFQMLQYHADAIIRRSFAHEGGPTYCERREAIDRMRRAYLHSGSGGMEVDYEGKPKGLELYSRKKRARILRTWTEVYDMLCAIVMQQAQQPGVDSENDVPVWHDGEPLLCGRYLCTVYHKTLGKIEKTLEYDPAGVETGSPWYYMGQQLADGTLVLSWWPLPDREG